jgi:hypothetical protein
MGTYWLTWAGYLSRYSYWLRAGRSGDRIPVWARFFAHVQTGPVAHPASCTMGTGSFTGVKRPGVVLTTHPLLVPKLRMGRAIPLPPLQGHEACNRVNLAFYIPPNTTYYSLSTSIYCTSSYMFRPVYNDHLQALCEEVFYIEYNYIAIILRGIRDLVLCAPLVYGSQI